MPINNTSNEIVHYQQPIFFLLNTPSRMYGELIEEVNLAMREVIPLLKRIVAEKSGILFNFYCMEFGYSSKWVVCADILDLFWLDVNTTGGTALGEAYHNLNYALSRKGFLPCSPCYAPIIILLLGATPHDDVKRGLEVLKKNKWFQYSIKIAIEVDDVPNPGFHQDLLDFTMDENAIIHADETNLRKILKDIMTRSVISGGAWAPPYNWGKYILSQIIDKPQIYTDIIEHKVPIENESTDDLWDDFDI